VPDRCFACDSLSGLASIGICGAGSWSPTAAPSFTSVPSEAGTNRSTRRSTPVPWWAPPGFYNTHTHLYESPLEKSFVADIGRRRFYHSGLLEYLPVRSMAIDGGRAPASPIRWSSCCAPAPPLSRRSAPTARMRCARRPRPYVPLHGTRLWLLALVQRRRDSCEVSLGRGGRPALGRASSATSLTFACAGGRSRASASRCSRLTYKPPASECGRTSI
jgi:hypothetical protein